MVELAGIDLLWFGIYLVLVVEMSQITPPVGFNLFVLQALTGKNILLIARYALPFFLLLMVALSQCPIAALSHSFSWQPSSARVSSTSC